MYFVKGGHENPITPHEDSFDELNLLSRGQSRQNLWRFDNRGAEPASWVDNPWLWAKYLRDRRIGVVVRYISPHAQNHDNA